MRRAWSACRRLMTKCLQWPLPATSSFLQPQPTLPSLATLSPPLHAPATSTAAGGQPTQHQEAPAQPRRMEDLAHAQAWARGGLELRCRGTRAAAAVLHAAAELPLPPLDCFQLMSHPENAAIFRGIERCTYRRVLWAAAGGRRADGRQTIEVENESGACAVPCARAAASPPAPAMLHAAQLVSGIRRQGSAARRRHRPRCPSSCPHDRGGRP